MIFFRIALFYFVLTAGYAGLAQHFQFSEDPAEFGTDVLNAMTATQNPNVETAGRNFEMLWNGGKLSDTQKKQIMETTDKLQEKGMHFWPDFANYFGAVVNAVDMGDIPDNELTNMLSMTSKVIENENNRDLRKFLRTLNHLFYRTALYYSRYNKLLYEGGTFSFEYIEPSEEIIPEEEIIKEPEQVEEDEFITEEDLEVFEADDGWGTEDDGWGDDGWGDDSWEDEGSGWDSEPATTDETSPIESQEEAKAVFMAPEPVQPVLQGPVFRVNKVDITLTTPYDSVMIINTSGATMLLEETFVAEGGLFKWKAGDFGSDSLYIELGKYNLKTFRPRFAAEKVKLVHSGLLSSPVEGTFKFDSYKRPPAQEFPYPYFQSYQNDIQYQNLPDEKIKLVGGITLMGQNISTAAVNNGDSKLTASREDRLRFRATSKKYTLEDSLLRARKSSITIYHGSDSIYHPSLKLDYYMGSSFLTVVKDHSGYKYTPFTSTFFDIDIDAEAINWDIGTDSLDIYMLNAKNQIPANFESHDYFDRARFSSFSQPYNFNPLIMAINYSHKVGSLEFYYEDVAENYNLNHQTVKSAMMNLMQRGYIDFNHNNGKIKIKRKAVHNVLAGRKKIDYDNLMIPSLSSNLPNATLDLKKQELKIRGIENFYISRELEVFIKPDSSEITLLKNRDFLFNGNLNAGNFEYIGQKFRFNYDSFLVVLPQVDSIKLNIDTEKRDRNNKIVKESLGNELAETAGVLYINVPNNKSARKKYEQYPIFDATKGALVYFDKPEILNGTYDKSIYFTIPPFKIDSVSSSDPGAISFQGTFHAGGIFPDFEEVLKVMPDKSLGFEHKSPQDGYPVYENSGRVYSDVKLDNNGLRGNGVIEYQTSTLTAQDIVFYMDSVAGTGTEAIVRGGLSEGASYPDVEVEAFKMKWLPYRDSMYVSNTGEPFDFYANTASLDGTAIISSTGLYGSGKFLTRGSETNSRKMTFTESQILARNADFEIKSSNPNKPALAGTDVMLDFDLSRSQAEVGPEKEGVAALDFPFAQFKTSISKATWQLDEQKVIMNKPEDVDILNSYFYTTREELDSLAFNATAGVYDIKNLTLNVSGIPYITVADAKITPENNEVMILENAEIQELNNANLVIDTLNEYHKLTDGNIKIISRNKFEGSATYQYVNAVQDTFAIKMGEFSLETEVPEEKGGLLGAIKKEETELRQFTVSSGRVEEKDQVVVWPGMIFKGTMKMYANKPALELDGYIKLDLERPENYDTWIAYQSSADVQEVIIPFDESITEDGRRLIAGLYFDVSTNSLYSTFITQRNSPDDDEFFIPGGLLRHDYENDVYTIAEEEKVKGESFQGKVFSYNEKANEVKFEGPLSFVRNLIGVDFIASGKGEGNLESNEYSMNTFLALDFPMPAQAVDLMVQKLKSGADRMGLIEANPDKTKLLFKMAEIVGDEATTMYEERSLREYTPLVSVSPKLAQALVLSNVDLKWSEEYKSFYSTGKIGLSNIGREDINASMNGFVEIKKDFEGTEINIFFQISPDTWYHFSYIGDRMLMFSSSRRFNNVIKEKSNVGSKLKLGQFVFMEGDMEETLDFVNRFRNLYYDIDTPLRLEMAVEEEFDAFKVGEDDGASSKPPTKEPAFIETKPEKPKRKERKPEKQKPSKEEEKEDFSIFGVEEEEEETQEDNGF